MHYFCAEQGGGRRRADQGGGGRREGAGGLTSGEGGGGLTTVKVKGLFIVTVVHLGLHKVAIICT